MVTKLIFSKNEEGLKSLFYQATIGMLVVNKAEIIVEANPCAEAIFGYAAAQLNGSPLQALIPENYTASHHSNIARYFANPIARPMGNGLELFGLKKNGELFPVEISLSTIRVDEQLMAVAFIRDLTDEKKSAEKFSKIFYESPVSVILSEAETGRIIDVNLRYSMLTGYDREALIGRTSLDLGLFSDPAERQYLRDKIKAEGKITGYEISIKTKNKGIVHVSLYAEPIVILGKSLYLTSLIDITETRKTKEKLIADQRRTRLLVEHTPAAVAMLDNSMNYIIVSGRWLQDYKLTENIIGRNHYEVFPNLPAEWKQYHQRCLAGETISCDEDSFINEEGTREWLKWQLCPWYAADHKIGGLIIFSEIITKEKNYMEALKNSELKLAEEADALGSLNEAGNRLWEAGTLEEGLNEMLAYSTRLFNSTMGIVQLINPRKKTLNIAASVGCTREFLKYFAEVGPNDTSACSRALNSQKQTTVEDVEEDVLFAPHLGIARRSGFRAIQSTPLCGKDGVPLGIISTHIKTPTRFNPLDLQKVQLYAQKAAAFLEHYKTLDTLKKLNTRLEAKVEERTKDLIALLEREKQLNEIKSRFVSIASHEFRTPLSIILSSADLIDIFNKNNNQAKIQTHAALIRSSVGALVEILENFLSLDKLNQGKVETANVQFNLEQFCKELVNEMAGILKKGQHITYSHSGQNNITGDKTIIKGILVNLLSNAIKYSGENKPIYLTTLIEEGIATMSIKDEGVGIPLEDQENLFVDFYRAKNTANITGTGLGLNIVKRYLELLDGAITFVSSPGEGTTFIVEFPVKPA
ncbi:MAG TPA: PAS domain S-box protein [Chitinophagaceae bacterium]|nr:PAS domain S-box protein [Chitinophagaceae bacterium]